MATTTPPSPIGSRSTPRSKTMSPNQDGPGIAVQPEAIQPEMGASEGEKRPAPEDDRPNVEDDQTLANEAPSKRAARVCGICNQDTGKYKCSRPQCTLMYHVHRDNHPPDPEKAPEAETNKTPTQQTKPKDDDPYRVLLEHSADIKRLFKKYPNLENDLAEIHRATLPPKTDDIFRSGLPFRLENPGGRGKKQQPWTRDLGLRNGAAALRVARTDPGDKGDGVREYCELVLYLLSRPEGSKMDHLVREEVLADDTKMIRRLMEEDRDKGSV